MKKQMAKNDTKNPDKSNTKGVKRSKFNKDLKKTVILIVVTVIAIYLIFSIGKLIKNPTDIFLVENGKLSQDESVIGYIIRDETVIKGQNYKNGMEQIKIEGEKVSKNEPIFRYYSSGEENILGKIAEIDSKIQQAMENDNSLFSSDIKLLETQIESKLLEIVKVNNIQKIQEYQKDINTYIVKKSKIAGDLSPAGSYLKKLVNERTDYEKQLNTGSEYINSTTSGIVSYRVDGLEEVITVNDFGKINKEFLEGLDLKTGQIVASSRESGKIINNFKAYVACISNSDDAKEAKVGQSLYIRLPSNLEVKGRIEYITKNDKEVILVIEISNGIEELINYRKLSFDIIWWEANGYKVPNTAIKEDGELNFVVRNKAGYNEKVYVNVKKKTDKYSVVTSYEEDDIKDIQNIEEKKDIILKRNISLYDEILLDPSKEKIENAR